MSALSTPGGGGTSAQSKPTSGKQKYQKLDINSLYCTNKNESSEPSSVKSQLSRKHGMQSLGKVPSARRPPANLPSLKTETGQDPNANPISTAATTAPAPATCITQTTTQAPSSGAGAGNPGGWVPLPPPSSPYSRTEFPSLEAAAQPSHRSSDHAVPQPQLRPQTEGSWTCGGTAGVRAEGAPAPAAPAASATAQQPHYRAILPSFLDCTNSSLSPQLIKGSSGGGLGPGPLGALRDARGAPRPAPRPPATPRAVEVLTARPILREEQISSLDYISRDAGWAQHDDIDYDQKLDFSDGESSAPSSGKGNHKSNHNRAPIDMDRVVDTKIHEVGDEEQLWAERRQKQSNEIAQVVARARQRKAEEQRRQMTDSIAPSQPPKERNDNREREVDSREKDRSDNRDRERAENRDRLDNRDKTNNDMRERDSRDKERVDNRDRDRMDNRERFDNRDRDRDVRERDRERMDNRERDRGENRDRGRVDNRDQRDRQEGEKDRADPRDRDRNENRGERMDRDRFDRERERPDNRERERGDRERDRDFRDRDYGREREQNNPAFSKTFQQNIPPRFLKQQQNRQQDDQHKGWAFSGKQAPRRQEQPSYNAPRHAPHNGRRSYSRDYSDREDEFRRDSKDGPGPQWRSEMQDYDKVGRELDRSNSKESYKEYSDHKDRRSDSDRKSVDSSTEQSSKPSAADKLTEVFERKSIGLTEAFCSDSSSQAQAPEKRNSSASNSQRESSERDFGKTSWAEASQDELNNTFNVLKSSTEKMGVTNDNDQKSKDAHLDNEEVRRQSQQPGPGAPAQQAAPRTNNMATPFPSQGQNKYHNNPVQNFPHNQSSQLNSFTNVTTQPAPVNHAQTFADQASKSANLSLNKAHNQDSSNVQSHPASEQTVMNVKPIFTSQKTDKELSESESIGSKSSLDPTATTVAKANEAHSAESLHSGTDSQKRNVDDKRHDRFIEPLNKISSKEPIERKSSGSGSEKKGRGYGGGGGGSGGGGGGGGCGVYRGWGSRETRGRRSHRSSHSNNRASESDGSTDGAPNPDRKERRRAPRSPRGPKKTERIDDPNRPHHAEQGPPMDAMENREPFAPRGQPSRRGRGGFQGTNRPPAPAKRVAGYGPPNTKSPFSQASRAVKDMDDVKDNVPVDDKGKGGSKPRTGSSLGRGRERRPKGGPAGPLSGEDENWETTSEHSEGGGSSGRRRSVGGRMSSQSHKGQGRNQPGNRQNSGRNSQSGKKDALVDNKTGDITEAMGELKLTTVKKEDEVADDGFQEVRNKKNSKETRGPPTKEETPNIGKQPRSHSNQGGGRNGSSTRNTNDKPNARGSAPVSGKAGPQYDRTRQANLAPRFVKQRQKQQMGLVTAFGPDTGAAPPPPPVNAWDKPISQTLRANVEESAEQVENKSGQSSQRSTPAEAPAEIKSVPAAAVPAATVPSLSTDNTGVLDGTTPPVETIIFENTNYKTAPPAEALKQKYQPSANAAKPQPQGEEISTDVEARALAFNGDVRPPPRSIQELISDRPVTDGENTLGLPMSFDSSQKAEDSSDMKLDFAFDSDLGQLTEDKSAKSALGLPRGTHMSTSNTISPLAADLNLKIASVKKVWEMSAVAEGSEELQFAGFEEANTETGAPPNVCKVKPTQQLQSPPPQHYNHMGYQGGYGGLSVPSPPAVLFNSSQQLLGSSQQLPQQGGLYGAFLDQSRGQFGGFPGTPYGAGSAAPYNYQPPPDMFQSLPSQYRMAAAAGGGAAFGQSGQLGNSPSTVLISSTSNSLMSASVKPSTQQIGAIGSKGAGVGGVGGVGGVNTYQQQYLGYSGPVGEAPYSLPGLMPRPAPPASSYYSPYQPPAAPAPTYPLQFTQPAQSGAFGSQFLSSQLQVAAAVQQMQQQQFRAPLQQQFAPPAPQRPPPQQLKSPLHEHANGFAQLCEPASPTPQAKPGKPNVQKPPHSPPQHKYHAPPPHPPPAHTPHQHHPQHPQHPQHPPHPQHVQHPQQHQQHVQHQQHQQHHPQQQQMGGNNGRCGGGGGGGMPRGGMSAPRYPAPIQRPHAPAMPLYRAPPAPARPHHAPRHNLYYHHHQRNGAGAGAGERAAEAGEPAVEEAADAPPADAPPADAKPE